MNILYWYVKVVLATHRTFFHIDIVHLKYLSIIDFLNQIKCFLEKNYFYSAKLNIILTWHIMEFKLHIDKSSIIHLERSNILFHYHISNTIISSFSFISVPPSQRYCYWITFIIWPAYIKNNFHSEKSM